MPRPPRDPSRPLNQAVRLARIIGAVSLLFGAVVLGGAMTAPAAQPGTAKIVSLVTGGIYLGFAIVFIALAAMVRRRRLWAVVVLMALAGMSLGVVAVGLFETVLTFIGGSRPRGIYMIVGVELLLAAAFGQLMLDLLRSRAFLSTPRGKADEALRLSKSRGKGIDGT